MDTALLRGEHEEFRRTVDAEIQGLNKRVTALESDNQKLDALTVSVQQLTDNIENMRKMQESEGERLKELENRDGDMWRKVVGYAITAIISIVIGFVFSQIGM